MTSKAPHQIMRRVVTGENAEGRSIIVSDEGISDWVRRPTGLSVAEVWRTDSLPARTGDMSSAPAGVLAAPAPAGLAVRIAVFPPDEAINALERAAYDESIKDLYGDQGDQHTSEIAGMHRTDTVDLITVVDGEIWVLLDEGESLLQTGDSLIQRGTRHAWRNRSSRPCTLVTTVLPAPRQ